MRYLSVVILLCAFCVSSLNVIGQVSKEEEKFWKEKAKMYKKNPLSLKAEFENMQEQISDLKNRNKTLMEELANASNTDLVDSLKWELVQLEGKLQSEQAQSQKLQSAYSSLKTVSSMGVVEGLVYRVQIGAYVFYEMEGAPTASADFVAERSDGFNKYVIGSFRTHDEANTFRDGLKKMGLEDPWVVPYIDGVRVTIDEANEYLQNQGQSSFLTD
ncbi:hypothetical protein [Pontibacter sp. G13]|uniref:hypothetical protein n=1 Tax=Pontibacter sp. G13 TaxID=3074898 RepID=UPI00288AE6CF|nr:hypothetical protein [Pontibacter sp. G13]WNJ20786.1 hypothetical protein RJD25_09910 [Pontibacter sp. G13]